MVCVEFDDLHWRDRTWVEVRKEFQLFVVECELVWAARENPERPGEVVAWPALTLSPIVNETGIDLSAKTFVEYLLDRVLAFKEFSRLQKFHEWDPGTDTISDDLLTGPTALVNMIHVIPYLKRAVLRWEELQIGQHLLINVLYGIMGYRLEVYRTDGSTQWYTAVIQAYDGNTGEITVQSESVLEQHIEHPAYVQMRFIGDSVQLILEGEPAQRRSSRNSVQAPPSPPPPARYMRAPRYGGLGASTSADGHLPLPRRRRGSRGHNDPDKDDADKKWAFSSAVAAAAERAALAAATATVAAAALAAAVVAGTTTTTTTTATPTATGVRISTTRSAAARIPPDTPSSWTAGPGPGSGTNSTDDDQVPAAVPG
ncbi:hypothetical protein ONE63_003117 [Megalurothrips usitatus]|uniref:Uncharacterized protein n=1 Tax=Megalurothrips usitatus TaxID=439358 RepID=A0AAV7XA06_9NEOP|nr:hypothetical protein ONE63_003117 [Megalurothrips usitatus]